MNRITVYCGNGGDWEYERDREWWIIWIDKNISGCWRIGGGTTVGFNIIPQTVGFKIIPHRDADKAIIEFDDPHNAVIFALKKPEYITSKHINL